MRTSTSSAVRALVCCVPWALGCGTVAAQASASATYLMIAAEAAPGSASSSASFALVGSARDGGRCSSPGFVLSSGLPATLLASTLGRPWLTAATPQFATPKGAQTITLYGAELDRGPALQVDIGGLLTTAQSRVKHSATVALPEQARPGWVPIRVSDGGSVSLLPRGLGILPLLYTEPAPAPGVAFDVVFKGSPGDQVVWAVSIAEIGPLRIGGFRYGLGLHPAAALILPGFSIQGPSGELRFPVPATNYTGSIYVQALFASNNPGYAPGSFSNVLRL